MWNICEGSNWSLLAVKNLIDCINNYLHDVHLADEGLTLFNCSRIQFVNKFVLVTHLKVFDNLVDRVGVLVGVVPAQN